MEDRAALLRRKIRHLGSAGGSVMRSALRAAESAVLAAVIERHPDPSTDASIRDYMTTVEEGTPPTPVDIGTPERLALVEEAVTGLSTVGLLRRDSAGAVEPTEAGLRSAELELGLPW